MSALAAVAALAAELRKTATLPSALVGVGVTVVGTVGVGLLNALYARQLLDAGTSYVPGDTSPVEAVFAAAPLGTVGAVVLGVVAMSSEYSANRADVGGGRQATTTFLASPRRLRVLVTKAVAVVLLVAGTAAVALAAGFALAHAVVGEGGVHDARSTLTRCVGVALYWALSGLMALALTVLTRSGVVPLVVLVTNSSIVSVSFLLSHVTPLARYLPDLAGAGLFAGDLAVEDPLGPLVGGVVMAAWAVGLLGVSAVVLDRRDA